MVVVLSGAADTLTNVVVRRELLSGLERLTATTTVLQRARLADPLAGMWEAADVQWWWRLPRATDELALPVWFDDIGPVAAAGLTAWDDYWQADVFAVPSIVDEADVWAATLEAAAGHQDEALKTLVREDNTRSTDLAVQHGFTMTDELSGTTWMDADERAPVTSVEGWAIVDRVTRADRPHPMIARNGELVEARLRQCSLYDPTLDLAVEGSDGTVAGYALFWFDHTTLIGTRGTDARRGRIPATRPRPHVADERPRSARTQRRPPPEGRLRERRRPQPLSRRRLHPDVHRSAAHPTSPARTVKAVMPLRHRQTSRATPVNSCSFARWSSNVTRFPGNVDANPH